MACTSNGGTCRPMPWCMAPLVIRSSSPRGHLQHGDAPVAGQLASASAIALVGCRCRAPRTAPSPARRPADTPRPGCGRRPARRASPARLRPLAAGRPALGGRRWPCAAPGARSARSPSASGPCPPVPWTVWPPEPTTGALLRASLAHGAAALGVTRHQSDPSKLHRGPPGVSSTVTPALDSRSRNASAVGEVAFAHGPRCRSSSRPADEHVERLLQSDRPLWTIGPPVGQRVQPQHAHHRPHGRRPRRGHRPGPRCPAPCCPRAPSSARRPTRPGWPGRRPSRRRTRRTARRSAGTADPLHRPPHEVLDPPVRRRRPRPAPRRRVLDRRPVVRRRPGSSAARRRRTLVSMARDRQRRCPATWTSSRRSW